MKKPKQYPIYYLRFYDHVLDNPQEAAPLLCEVFGVLWKQCKLAYYVNSWVCNRNLTNANNETYVILKSTVIEKKRIA